MTQVSGGADVIYGVSGQVATITFNRPDKRNRLTPEAMALARVFIDQAVADPEVRAVVMTGSGNTFCSGADLTAAVQSVGDNFTNSGPAELVLLLTAILDCPKPTIARVQGHVAAGGTGVVAACDIAVAVDDARFAFSEVRLGLAPAVISVVCLSVMNRRDAQELLLTGERVDADRVLRAGLLTGVVPAEAEISGALDAEVARYAGMLAKAGPLALAHTKELLRRVPTLDRAAGFTWTSELSAGIFASAEGFEGMSAFLGKRLPEWDRS